MSLIVARVENNDLHLYSDTKITDFMEVRNNPLTSNLKTFILNPKTCVSFAGNVTFAEKFLDIFVRLPYYNFIDILELCFNLNIESNDSIEFGLAYIDETETMQLFKIKNSKVEEGLKNFWLGDINAYNVFQRHYLNDKSENPITYKMASSFDEVIQNDSIESVGNFVIGVESWIPQKLNEKILTYQTKAKAIYQSSLFKFNENIDGFQFLPQGNAQEGGFSECYLRSLTLEFPAIAIYFYQGNFGILFCIALNKNHPIIIRDMENPQIFANYIKKEYNILLHGFTTEGFYFQEIIGK